MRGSGEYDGAIVDVMLGTDSGIDLVRNTCAQGAALPIIMLSALSDVEHRAAGLEAVSYTHLTLPTIYSV